MTGARAGPDITLKRLLVAYDGQPQAGAAVRFARLLAQQHGASVEVVAVYEPRIPIPRAADESPGKECESCDRPAVAEFRDRIQRDVRMRLKESWPIHFRVGHAPWIIADLARALQVDLIVLGHDVRGVGGSRRHTRHTAEQLALAADVPIVAVPTDFGDTFPHTIVAVADGSNAARRGERLSRALLAPRGALHVVARLAELPAAIQSHDADLATVPMPGDSFAVRSLMGGGVAHVLDHERCGVLVGVAEPSAATHRSEIAGRASGVFPMTPASDAGEH